MEGEGERKRGGGGIRKRGRREGRREGGWRE